MNKIYYAFIATLFFGFSSLFLTAQESHGGEPYSTMFDVAGDFQHIELQAPDMDKIRDEDMVKDAMGGPGPQRMGVSVKVNVDLISSATQTEIPGTGKIWRLSLKAPGALALGVYYDDFYIPEGGELFLYNHDKSQLIGSFTHKNNPAAQLYATQFVQGDLVILEYFQPESVSDQARIHISELAYAYRHIDFVKNKETESLYCMIDVACEEGDGWENQIRGVARISIKIGGSYFWCSGSLINNTANDRTPYFLTASHCGGNASASDLNQWIFYFNYQAAVCDGASSGYNSKTGCSLKARDPSQGDDGSDFYLVQFNSAIPNSYNVYYNGWNRTNSAEDAPNGVGIHHPAGDIKKISTYDTPLVSSTYWNGMPTHWKLIWAETVNGRSIMEGGSSGSPVFDANGLIMGDLTGGYVENTCTDPSPAWYGKVYWSWDQNGSTNATQLKPWLDSDDTGIEKLPGVSWEIIPPEAAFISSVSTITQGDTVFYSDISGPGILEREWTFDGGEPEMSTEQYPYVVYVDSGNFDVSLYVVNADGTDTKTVENYVHVNQMALPEADFEADDLVVSPSQNVKFTDLSTNNPNEWYWEFEGGSPATSTNENPTVRYSSEGVYTVSLIAYNLGGSDTIVKENYITVSTALPAADFEASNTHITQGSAVNFTDMSEGSPDEWLWTFDGGIPESSTEQNPENIVYNEGGAFSVTLTVENGNGESTEVKEDYILVDWVGVEEFSSFDDFRIYPNPGTGIFVLEFAQADSKEVELLVTNALGKQIMVKKFSKEKNTFVLNLSDYERGIYFISIDNGREKIVKKISLIQ